MPILPIIDLLILLGWTTLFGAFALKAIHVTTHYRPELFGMGPMDMVITAASFLLFALALAARTWVKSHEDSRANANARVAATLDAYNAAQHANGARNAVRESGDAAVRNEAPARSASAGS
jgi:hypothetical protein